MAFCGPWGVFYHIPKTGGSWIRQCLRDNMGGGHESGNPHGWLHPYEKDHPAQPFIKKGPFFTFVRHPATWLRSFWAHAGEGKWIGRDKNDGHWGTLCWVTKSCESGDFEEFALNVIEKLPGLVSWFQGTYCLPNLIVGCMEDYPHSLKVAVPDLFCTKPPRNKANKPLPGIDDLLIKKIEQSEPWLMERYYQKRDHRPIEVTWELNFVIPDRGATNPAYMKGE